MDRSCQQYFDSFSQTPEGELRNEYYNPFAVRHRKKTTQLQLEVLEKTFETNIRPDTRLRRMLADQLGMTPRSIQVWFQNRRAKEKKIAEKHLNRYPFCSFSGNSHAATYASGTFFFSATNNSLYTHPFILHSSPDTHPSFFIHKNTPELFGCGDAKSASQGDFNFGLDKRFLGIGTDISFDKDISHSK